MENKGNDSEHDEECTESLQIKGGDGYGVKKHR